MNHVCPVCGYVHLKEMPRQRKDSASFEICPSCGFQFGVSDDDRGHTYESWRQDWIARGMPWSSRQKPPADWNAAAQILRLDALGNRPSAE